MAVFHTNSGNVRRLLAKRFCAPEWSLFFEVATQTGAGAVRYADAVAMNLWPSRGLAIHGFEIKVSRSDWLSELRNPAKADAMANNCDHWWVVAAKGCVQEGELPPTWGLFEVDGRGLVCRTKAPKLPTPELSREFMASFVRRAGEFDDREKYRIAEETRTKARKEADERIEREVKERSSRYTELQKAVTDFETASGLKISDWRGGENVGKAVALVERLGINTIYGGAREAMNAARRYADGLEKALAGILPDDNNATLGGYE